MVVSALIAPTSRLLTIAAASCALVVLAARDSHADDTAGKVTFASPDTRVDSKKEPPAVALPLTAGQRVTTEKGRAGVRVHDTEVVVEPSSSIRLRDGTTTPNKGVVDVVLLSGSLRAGPSPGTFNASSPGSYTMLTFDKAEAFVSIDDKGTTRVAVKSGSVEITAWKKSVVIPAGSSSKVERGWKPTQPEPLPSAPTWSKTPEEFAWAKDGVGNLGADFAPGAGTPVVGWHLQIGRDAEFKQVLTDERTAADKTKIAMPLTDVGSYFARVAGVDADGFEGPWSTTIKTTLGKVTWRTLPGHRAVGEVLPLGMPCAVDGGPLEPVKQKFEFETWVPHDLRCKLTDTGEPTVIAVPKDEVSPLGLVAKWISKTPTEQRGEIVVRLTDKTGSPLPARKLALTSDSADVKILEVDPAFEGGRYFVKVRWTNKEASFHLQGKLGPEEPKSNRLGIEGDVNGEPTEPPIEERFDVGLGVGPAMVLPGKPVLGGRVTGEAVYWSKLGSSGSLGIGIRPSFEIFAQSGANLQNLLVDGPTEVDVSHELYSASVLIGYRADGGGEPRAREGIMPYLFVEPIVGFQDVRASRPGLPDASSRNGAAGIAGTVGLDLRHGKNAVFVEASGRYVGQIGGADDFVRDTGVLLTGGYRFGL